MMEHPELNHYVDITATYDTKIAAVMTHESQHPDPEGLPKQLRTYFQQNAADAGFPDGHYAEPFTVIRLDS